MFRLPDPDQSYVRIVTVNIPTPDGGVAEKKFKAYFLFKPTDEVNELLFAGGADGDYAFCSAILSGWEDIEVNDGTVLKFTNENVRMLSQIGYWVNAVTNDYLAFVRGEPAKNSKPLPDTGSAAGQETTS